MAEINPDDPFRFAAAASTVAVTTSRRLIRNFRYYRSQNPDSIFRDELVTLCRSIRQNVFGLQNLMEKEPEHSPFFVSIAGEINNQLEELHRKLLFFDADSISEIIPLIDTQRSFWKNMDRPEFYSGNLISALERDIPLTLELAENKMKGLPESATP